MVANEERSWTSWEVTATARKTTANYQCQLVALGDHADRKDEGWEDQAERNFRKAAYSRALCSQALTLWMVDQEVKTDTDPALFPGQTQGGAIRPPW